MQVKCKLGFNQRQWALKKKRENEIQMDRIYQLGLSGDN